MAGAAGAPSTVTASADAATAGTAFLYLTISPSSPGNLGSVALIRSLEIVATDRQVPETPLKFLGRSAAVPKAIPDQVCGCLGPRPAGAPSVTVRDGAWADLTYSAYVQVSVYFHASEWGLW